MNNVFKMAVLGCTALSMTVSQTAFAAVTVLDATPAADPTNLTPENLAIAQTACDGVAAGLDLDGPSAQSDTYTADVHEGAVTLQSGPTETGTHSTADALAPLVPGLGATFTPASIQISGTPFRNGGSVNMFGMATSVGGYYSTSAYDFMGDFSTTYRHAYTCDITSEEYHAPVYHPAVFHPAVPVQGYYVVEPTDQGNEEASQNSCNAFTANGPTWEHWGEDHAQCDFVTTHEAVAAYTDPAYTDPEYWDAPVPVVNTFASFVDQAQPNELRAHENAGAGYFDSAPAILGKVVVCISPSSTGTKRPGAWVAKNGYNGGSLTGPGAGCNTTWYDTGAKLGVANLNLGGNAYNVTVPLAAPLP